MLRTAIAAALVALAPFSIGCSRSSGPPDPSQIVGSNGGGGAPADAEARDLFDHVCAMCHGADGHGDGPNGASLNPKPRDYTDQAWQASVKDDELRQAILDGGAAVGKSAAMPPNPNLRGKPEVVEALVRIVRSYKRQ